MQKLNTARKLEIYVFGGLGVKARLTNLQKYLKSSFSIFIWFMTIFNIKKMLIRSLFTSNLTFINPYNVFFILKSQKVPIHSLYSFAAQQQTSTLRCKKAYSIHWKFSVQLSELTRSFRNPREMTEKMQKPNNARKL